MLARARQAAAELRAFFESHAGLVAGDPILSRVVWREGAPPGSGTAGGISAGQWSNGGVYVRVPVNFEGGIRGADVHDALLTLLGSDDADRHASESSQELLRYMELRQKFTELGEVAKAFVDLQLVVGRVYGPDRP